MHTGEYALYTPMGEVKTMITNAIYNKGSFLAFVLDEQHKYSFRAGDANFESVCKAYESLDLDALRAAVNGPAYVAMKLAGDDRFEINDGEVSFNGTKLNNALAERIVQFCKTPTLDPAPVIAFIERVFANPNPSSILDLYEFLTHRNLPIGRNGCFYSYKGITDDYKDCHTQKVDNNLGATPRMERKDVEFDRKVHCGKGYHVGSFSFASGFGKRMTIIEIDPADVISVPEDANCQKMRICGYKVVAETTKALPTPHWDPSQELRVDGTGAALSDRKTYKTTCNNGKLWSSGREFVWDATTDAFVAIKEIDGSPTSVPFLQTLGRPLTALK